MSGLWQDCRYGLRMLARAPGVSAAAVVLLSLGIGANTAIFSLIRGILMRAVPGVHEPDRVVRFIRVQGGQRTGNFGYPDFTDYREQARLLIGAAAEAPAPLAFANGTTARIRGALVSGNYFEVLGVKPALGRLFTQEDDREMGAHWVAVISHGLWQRVFASDPAVLGKAIRLNGHDYKIVGVAAPEFQSMTLGATTDVWLPLQMQPQAIPRMTATVLSDRMAGWIAIYGRLRPDVQMEQANAELQAIAQQLALAYPKTNEGRSVELAGGVGLYPQERAKLRRLFGLLFVAVGLLLLIACCNVANLLLARAMSRRREMAVRLALGAGRSRLIRQMLSESLLLCLLAAAAGLTAAPWSLVLLRRLFPPQSSLSNLPLHLDSAVLGFTLLLSIVTGLAFGLVPAFTASKTGIAAALKDAVPASGFHHSRFAQFSVMVQVSLSLILLIGGGLVVKTIRHGLSNAGEFSSEQILVASMDLSILDYPQPRARMFFGELQARLERIPGVSSASLAKTHPAAGWSDRSRIFYEGQEPDGEEERNHSELGILTEKNTVSPGYFRTLGIPLLAGRDFGQHDTAGAPLVAIVSQKLAARMWPGESALGRRITVPAYRGPRRPPVEIIGVAADVKYRSLLTDPPVLLYLSLLQNHEVFVGIQVRSAGDAAALAPLINREVAALDRNMPVFNVRTLSEQLAVSLWEQRAAAGLIGVFGVIALLVACVGLYSVVAHAVAHRTREIGIRMALGAQRNDVLGLVVRGGMMLATGGALAGLAATLVLSRFVSGFLYGVSAADPATLAGIAILLLAVSLAASYLPARAATRIDPLAALRHE